MLAAAEAAQDDAAFAADRVGAEAGALFVDIQKAWDGRDRPRLRELIGGDLLVEWERRLDDFDAKGWHSRVQRRAASPRSSTWASSTARPTRRTAPSCASARRWTRGCRRPTASGSTRPATTTRGSRSPSTGRWPSTTAAGCSSRSSRTPRARITSTDEIVASPWSDSRLHDEALVEQAVADRVPEGFSPADAADLRLRRQRARGGARPVAGRRALPARRARGGRAARRRGVGRGRRRRGRRARARGLARGDRRAALRRRRAAPHAPGGARAAHRARGHRARRRAGAAGAHDGDDRRPRPALPRGPRHRRGGRRLARARGERSRSTGSWPSTAPTTRRGASSGWTHANFAS